MNLLVFCPCGFEEIISFVPPPVDLLIECPDCEEDIDVTPPWAAAA